MLKKMQVAVPKRTEHVVAFHEFEQALPKAMTEQWTCAVELWEEDNTNPNPFQTVVKSEFMTSRWSSHEY